MSAVLRASGAEFDVDRFCSESILTRCAAYRRGEPRLPATRPNGPRREESGINILVSEAEFGDLPQQTEDAITFLRLNRDAVAHLCSFPGVESVCIDFAIIRRDVFVQFDFLSSAFIRLAGELVLAVELSQYPVSEEPPSEGPEA